jgi:protein-arginine kinase activator protein McsA
MQNEENIEINVINGENFVVPKDVYIQWLNHSLEVNINDEEYEECAKIREKINHFNELCK